jgi:hypothetical protein
MLDIFFKKNEEVIWSPHLLTYLLKFGERGPQYFGRFHRIGRIYSSRPIKKSHRDGSYCSGGFQSAVNRNRFLLSPIGTVHLIVYMRRAYGTQLIFGFIYSGLKSAATILTVPTALYIFIIQVR